MECGKELKEKLSSRSVIKIWFLCEKSVAENLILRWDSSGDDDYCYVDGKERGLVEKQ